MADAWRKLTWFSGDDPSTEELRMLQESTERVRRVIHARWAVLGLLAAYGLYVFVLFQHGSADTSAVTPTHQVAGFLAFLGVAACNAWYRRKYRWLGRIRAANQVQLLVDLVFVTVVVHFSGGAVSWFWSMYAVLTLEAVMILDRPSDPYAVALACSVAYGGLLTFEFYELLPPIRMPFVNNALQRTFSYVMLRWAWASVTSVVVAVVGVYLMGAVRARESQVRELVIRDDLTALYNRRYLYYRLGSELQRAKRYGRKVSLLLLDVDDFKTFNDRFGHLAGDTMLRRITDVILANLRRSDREPSYEVDIACRYGGEKFALILPEAESGQRAVAAGRIPSPGGTRGAFAVAERIRREIEKLGCEGTRVTVSIGVSSYPADGVEVEGLIRAADDATYAAKRSGKNRVAVAGGEVPPSYGAPREETRG